MTTRSSRGRAPEDAGPRVILARGAEVSARILAAPWVAPYGIGSATLVGEDPDARPGVSLGGDGIGGVLMHGCPPLRRRLTVTLRKGDWALVDEEVVFLGRVDLGVLDLHGALRACHVRVLDAEGGVVAGDVEVRAVRG